MRHWLARFWRDETGTVPADWACIATILVLGAITGAIAARQAALDPPEDYPPAVRLAP